MNLPFLFAETASETAQTAIETKSLFGGYCLDLIVFFGFLLLVIFVAFRASRKSGDSSESYFLAGRGLSWWLIGFSLIAANISAEQFVGMSGQASDYIGLAVASYEWIAALSLVIVAFVFLPRFLKAGIYTIPEYLEQRYNKAARTIMSIFMMIMLVAVNITVVTYAGAKAYAVFFDNIHLQLGSGDSILFSGNPLNLTTFCWIIGIIAAIYIFAGGLKACAWADLLQGSALIIAGAVVLYYALKQLGIVDPSVFAGMPNVSEEAASKLANADAWTRFTELNASKLRMNLPSWDTIIPVTALVFAIWIPNLYYWGLNQYIIQRTLGAKSLGEGQKGLVFAAGLKLLIPFIVIFPGLIAFNLYHNDMRLTSEKKAANELARFEQLSADLARGETISAETGALFSFNHDFANLYPEKAQAMLNYNSQVSGVEIPTKDGDRDLTLSQQLAGLRAGITKVNQEQELTYRFADENMITGFDHDSAFPLLIRNLVPTGGFKGFLLAALLGAIISSVASMLNAASTIFTMDIYKEYVHRKASEKTLVLIGRCMVIVFVLIGCFVAPMWANPKHEGVFKAIQEFQGYISPGIFAAFGFGFIVRKAPACCGWIALVLCPILYGLLKQFVPSLDFLNRMAVTFIVIIAVLSILRILFPQKEAFVQKDVIGTEEGISADFLKGSITAKVFGVIVVIVTLLLYFYYWDFESPMF
ncbi:MAG: sodium/solute symporter [Planctomycetia bacterium]|nr:sodium/solute symporter [Planctomycetia bacterium]